MKTEIFLVCLVFAVGNGLSVLSEEKIKTKEVIKNVVKLQTEKDRKSDGEIAVDFDRFSGGICLLDEHCAFFMLGNMTVQISYCDYTAGTSLSNNIHNESDIPRREVFLTWRLEVSNIFLAGMIPGFDGECRLSVWVWVSLVVVVLLVLLLVLTIAVCCWKQFNNITGAMARGFAAVKCWWKDYHTI